MIYCRLNLEYQPIPRTGICDRCINDERLAWASKLFTPFVCADGYWVAPADYACQICKPTHDAE